MNIEKKVWACISYLLFGITVLANSKMDGGEIGLLILLLVGCFALYKSLPETEKP